MNKYQENLKVGQIYKSYRQVCEALGEKVKSGNSRNAQIAEWELNFRYSKDGNKFIIEEIYDSPKEKVETRGGSNNNHVNNLLSLILVNTLNEEEDNSLKLTLNRLYEIFNMVNPNFREYKYKNNELSKYLNIDVNIIKEFYNLNHNNFKRMVENSLNRLQDERIIMYNKITYVSSVGEKVHRPANEQEKVTIMYIEKLLLNKYDCESYPDIFYSKDYDSFQQDSRKLMKEFNINYYYFVYDITINKLFIGEKLKELIISNDIFFDKKKELNQTIIDKITYNADKRKSNALESKVDTYTTYIRSGENYLDDYANLIRTLINDDYEITKRDIELKLQELREIDNLIIDDEIFSLM